MTVGRYEVHATIAKGGMGAVHLGRLLGAVGFGRIVAIKRMHSELAGEPEIAAMFVDEARLASRIQHPNVAGVLDVVQSGEELLLVMEYVRGEALSSLLKAELRAGRPAPIPVIVAVASHALHGLHAAHEARGADGTLLELVHRDISPQNILVGVDGLARVVDFGIAKSTQRLHSTREGAIKGKPAYMAPEQLSGQASRRTDIYAAGVVLWEGLAGRRLFAGESDVEVIAKVMESDRIVAPPSQHRPEVSAALDAIVAKAVAADPAQRFATAREMAIALEQTGAAASVAEVGAWVESVAGAALAKRDAAVASIESSGRPEDPPPDAAAVGPATLSVGSQPRPRPDPNAETQPVVALPPAGSAREPITLTDSVRTGRTGKSIAPASRSPLITLAAAVVFLVGAGVLAFALRAPSMGSSPSSPAASNPTDHTAPPAPSPSAALPVAPSASAASPEPDGGVATAAPSVAPLGSASAPLHTPRPRTKGKPAPDFL